MKDTVIKRLLEENEKLRKKRSNVESRLVNIESSLNQLEQYGRRNNIIINDKPDDVSDNQLKEVVIKIFADADDNVKVSDFLACHRFGKSDRNSQYKNNNSLSNRKH